MGGPLRGRLPWLQHKQQVQLTTGVEIFTALAAIVIVRTLGLELSNASPRGDDLGRDARLKAAP